MVIISRKRDEALLIGDDIVVTVVEIRGDKVRLGIDHPAEVPVHRAEVLEAMKRGYADPPLSAPASNPIASAPAAIKSNKIDRRAAALQRRLGVPVSREMAAESMREAGIET